ncbi:unnamed protein product [Caenorhabditis angaria]|uniref:Uncharacterized protein n=1 Tax=Caenorhabditis angaria TaxID=860376 RepID=A0A9P1IAP2_9PELO|nr:unnamed protein product [Caenorhabditis angaria]
MWVTTEQLKKEKTEQNARKREAVETSTEADVIASFVHNRPTDLNDLAFERHYRESRREAPIMTVRADVSENVVEIGEEVNCLDEGFDFAVAIVDTVTGSAVFKPARLYSFESKYSEDVEKLIGQKNTSKKPIDYKEDYDITTDKWAEKRRQLTHNFGSSKKIKMDEAAQRRTIKQDTLDEMKKTAFASNSNVKDEEVKLSDISLVQKAASSILPPAVQADLSKDIYPISLFLSEQEIEAVADEALLLMEKKRKEKIEAGIPEPVVLIMFNEHTRQRASAYLLLATMVEILQKLGKSRSILRKEMNDLKLPNLLRQKVQAEYFSESTSDRGFGGKGAERVKLNTADFDRFIAYALALALTLAPEHKIPLSPFQTMFAIPPSKLEKMLEALGADIIRLDVTTAQQLKSLRGAVLLKPPSVEQKPTRKLKRR